MIVTIGAGQSAINFSRWSGTAFAIPEKELDKGYGAHVHDNEVLGEIEYDSLYFPEENTKDYFQGIKKKSGFGMVLYTEVEVNNNGCFEFSINSDDGSILWLNNKRIIDNDGYHSMRLKIDTVFLEPGKYQARFWYHNAFPTRRGLIFNYTALSIDSCKKVFFEEKQTIEASILFEFDESSLRPAGKIYLDSLAGLLANYKASVFTIIGHTDSIGTEEYNQKLSLLRAQAVKDFLSKKLPSYTFNTSGQGASQPLVENRTPQNRARNRRVEIVVDN